MLNFALEEHISPSKEMLVLLDKISYKVNKGTIKVLNDTNLKFIKPTTYAIKKPTKLTIYEYQVNEINNKNYYIKEHNKKYSLKEIIISVLSIKNKLMNQD